LWFCWKGSCNPSFVRHIGFMPFMGDLLQVHWLILFGFTWLAQMRWIFCCDTFVVGLIRSDLDCQRTWLIGSHIMLFESRFIENCS
jgi:hypothetical protein